MKLNLIVCFVFVLSLGHKIKAQDYSGLTDQFKSSKILNDIHYGFSLFELDNDNAVFGIRENQHFTPASNTKVYTLFSSLKHLGDSIVGLKFVERGDSLIFWGTGDPTFLHPNFDQQKVYHFLKNSKRKLFYVPQESTELPYRNGWSIEDYEEYYQPDVSPFPIYGNVVRFTVKDESIQAIPSYFEHHIKRNTPLDGSGMYLKRSQYTNTYDFNPSRIGGDLKTSKPFIWSDSLFTTLLQDTLKKEVYTLNGYSMPEDVKGVNSVPRDLLLREMMLPSDNFFAEQLTMLISQSKYNAFQTDSLRKYMQSTFYSQFQDTIILRDGSGLSTYNKITPRNMVDLLLAIAEIVTDEEKRYYLFPTGGIDGTLRTAYELDLSVPFVWAKTGTLNGVHCQSGYLETRSGKRYVFSFLNNNYVVPTSEIRKEMVRIITYIRQNF